MSERAQQLPPQNLDAEESVLGAMMLAPNAVDKATDILEGREFYRDTHGKVFEAITALYQRGDSVDAITVTNELRTTGMLEAAGGEERIHELASLAVTSSNVAHWANIVRTTWLERGLARAGRDLYELGMSGVGTIEERIAEADGRVIELQGFLERKSDTVSSAKQLVQAFREKLASPPDQDAGVQTPWPFLRPLQPSRVYVLGGYQGFGKTAMARQFVGSACGGGARVGFHSIEMSKSDLTDQLIAMFGVPSDMTQSGVILPEFADMTEKALAEIETWDFEVIDDEAVTPSVIRRSQRRGKYDFLIIDHLHRMPIKNPRHQREELEEHIRRITNIAREFSIPVLLLAQLSRGDLRDPFPRPTMASLRGSGMIEAEAACVWFVWRKCDKQHQPGSDAEFIIAKNRFGALGWQPMWFQSRQVKFNWQRGESAA